MKKVLWGLLFSMVTVVLFGSAAFGAVGPYMSVQAGATWLEDTEADFKGAAFFPFESEFDTGFNMGAAIGYDYGMSRLEGEIAYRLNDFDQVGVFGSNFDADGDVSALSFMVNGFFDMENPSPMAVSPVVPYLGAGIGFATVSVNDLDVEGEPFVDDDDTVFAYQVSAGVGFEVNSATTLELGYRYFATSDPEFTEDFDGDKFESEYNTHNFTLGLRFTY